jgi:hypothetical protein
MIIEQDSRDIPRSARDDEGKKAESKIRLGFLNYYPADAV